MILLLFHNINLKYKLIYLHITHSQSIFPKFLILVLNSDTDLLDLISLGRLLGRSLQSITISEKNLSKCEHNPNVLLFDFSPT